MTVVKQAGPTPRFGVLIALGLVGCGRAPLLLLEGTEPGRETPDAGFARDAGRPPARADAGSTEPDPCGTHTDCPCPEGICLSTGRCWCPPCETDDQCGAGQVCRQGHCVDFDPACVGPLRMSPGRGPTTGGTIITVEGMEFYIGALEWMAQIGDGPPLMPVPAENAGGLCRMAFMSTPMAAGSYPVQVAYGGGVPSDVAGYQRRNIYLRTVRRSRRTRLLPERLPVRRTRGNVRCRNRPLHPQLLSMDAVRRVMRSHRRMQP